MPSGKKDVLTSPRRGTPPPPEESPRQALMELCHSVRRWTGARCVVLLRPQRGEPGYRILDVSPRRERSVLEGEPGRRLLSEACRLKRAVVWPPETLGTCLGLPLMRGDEPFAVLLAVDAEDAARAALMLDFHSVFANSLDSVFQTLFRLESRVRARQRRGREQRARLGMVEAACVETERRMETLLSNLPGLAYRCRNDRHWTMEFISDGCEALTGLPAAALLGNVGMAYNDLIHPEDRAMVWDQVHEALDARRPFCITYRIRRASGEIRWVWERGQGIVDDRGETVALEGFIGDITDQKGVEEAYRRSEERLARALEASNDGLYDCDLVTGENHLSPRYLGMLGYGPDEVEPTFERWASNIHPDDRAMATATLRRYHEDFTISSHEIEYRMRHRNGEWRWILSRGCITARDAEGRPLRLVGTHMDVTERRSTEAALRESEERFRRLIEAAPMAIGVSRVGTTMYANPAYAQLFGFDRPEDLEGGSLLEQVAPCSRADIADRVARRARGEEVSTDYEAVGLRRDGTEFDMQVSVTSVPVADGVLTVAFLQDISRRKRAERRRERIQVELERRVEERTAALAEANRELEAFAYTVSHDLRTPLCAINGCSDLLDEEYGPRLDEQGLEYLGIIQEQARRMDALIEALLFLSQVTRREMHRDHVDLAALVPGVVESLRRAEPDRQVEVIVTPDLHVEGDPHLLLALLQNLMGNAWKFTSRCEEARVEVGVTEMEGERVFYVRDNGAGFDSTHASRLFAPFQRLHHKDDYPGSGVGLATVRRIVHRHGGRVWAEGSLGKGATVYFTL